MPAMTSSSITPIAPRNFLSSHETGQGLMISKKRKRRKAIPTDDGVRTAGIRAIHSPTTSSMTIMLESFSLTICSKCFADHKPSGKAMRIPKSSAGTPPIIMSNIPKGSAPSVPHVPGAGRIRPQPNHVASHVAGCLNLMLRSVS